MIESESVHEHKAAYIALITSHVSSSLFETTKNFKEIIEINNTYNEFVFDNIFYKFSKFIYDPASKDRILNLLIYFISLIALLIATKPDIQHEYAYFLLSHINMKVVLYSIATCIFFIFIGYISIVIPFVFLRTFFINPILLSKSFGDITVHYLN